MGIVFLARDVSLDRPVAIKLLPPALAGRPALRERFLQEARIAARLSHPNIVPIHAVEESGDLVWFVMTYVPGETLGARLRERGSLPPAEVVRILRDVAWALSHAHAQGVVHRDVKPDNILLETGGRRALIADFGIAAAAEQHGEVAGTLGYLSPEQATGQRLDGRADLYALGVVGYYALSGQLPYPVATLDALIERQIAGAPPSLAKAAPHVPRALTRPIDRCLSPLPTARFQTGEELAGALEQLGAGSNDLPAAFRVWIAKGNQRRGPAILLSLVWVLPIVVGSIFAMASAPGSASVVSAMLFTTFILLLPWSIVLSARLLHTRRLLAAGYSHADLVLALEQHVERRREELAFEHGTTPTRTGTLVNGGILLGGAVAILALAASFLVPGSLEAVPLGLAAAGGGTAAVLLAIRDLVPGARSGARDRWAEFALKFWKGPVGRRLTALAGWRLQRRSVPDEILHRPTELALGDAADALFRALPAAERRDLKTLPEEIRHLSEQAQSMRHKVEELDDLIAEASPTTLFDGEKAAGDGGAGALIEARTLWAERLRETVTMLESLRVGLLKLHGGGATPQTLTEDLAAARALKDRLGLLLQGHAEAQQALERNPT
jgi:serine/threonine-protein kinase